MILSKLALRPNMVATIIRRKMSSVDNESRARTWRNVFYFVACPALVVGIGTYLVVNDHWIVPEEIRKLNQTIKFPWDDRTPLPVFDGSTDSRLGKSNILKHDSSKNSQPTMTEYPRKKDQPSAEGKPITKEQPSAEGKPITKEQPRTEEQPRAEQQPKSEEQLRTVEEGLNAGSSIAPRTPVPRDEKVKSSRDSARRDPKEELREQLKIQLAAYSDYLKEQLHLQENELKRMHSIALEENILEEKMRYQRELATSIERLREVERILQVREKLDREEDSCRILWLICQRLNSALKSDPKEGVSNEPRQILANLQETIDKLANESETASKIDTLSKLALKSIPKGVFDNGVYSEDALIQRFEKVDRLCKRVSLVDEQNSTLMRYALSFIQSMLIVDRSKISDQELKNEELDVSKLGTYDILARVKHFLRERNLEMSLRYANQLRGEPRRVASDWIRDVRHHLEVRQVSSIVQAQCSAATLRTLNK